MNIITTCRRQPRKREIGRAENPAPTEKYLGYPSKTSNCRKSPWSGSLRSPIVWDNRASPSGFPSVKVDDVLEMAEQIKVW